MMMSSDFSPVHSASRPDDFDGEDCRAPILNARQLQILKWVQEGKSSWEIGAIIGISGRTVEGHLRKIYAQLDVHTRLHAVLRAHDLGLLQRPRTLR